MIFEKSIKFLSMEETVLFIKSSAVILFIWLFDSAYLSLLSISVINDNVREVLVELKELMGFIVSALVLIITVIKLRRLVKNKQENKSE